MSVSEWKQWIEDCRSAEKPVVPTPTEPWFSVEWVCEHFLMIESVRDFVKSCKDAGIQIMRINRKPLIRLSSLEKFIDEPCSEDTDGVQDPVPSEPEVHENQPRRRRGKND